MSELELKEAFHAWRAARGELSQESAGARLADRYYRLAAVEAERNSVLPLWNRPGVRKVVGRLKEKAGHPPAAGCGPDTGSLEQKLLDMRFSFSRVLSRKASGYRDLLKACAGGSPGRERALAFLREEQRELIRGGFADLVRARNRFAVSRGYPDYWRWKHRHLEPEFVLKLEAFFSRLVEELSGLQPEPVPEEEPAGVPETQPDPGARETADRFFGCLGDLGLALPGVTLDWKFVPGHRGPPEAFLLEAPDPEGRGCRVELLLPCTPDGPLDTGGQELLYHELTHALHFAGVRMPSVLFSDETLAPDPLLYESQALALSRIAARKLSPSAFDERSGRAADLRKLKDLVLVGWGERMVYREPDWSPARLEAAVVAWERELYRGDPPPRPALAASHLIRGDLAGTYLAYAAAFWYGLETGRQLERGERGMEMFTGLWAEGNAAGFDRLFADTFDNPGMLSGPAAGK